MIDLRSDTVTLPSPGMREAMASAPVGDDQFGEDPSVNDLQDRVAGLLGKDAALWVPTGTMANQVALRTLTAPGDDVVVAAGAHVVVSETGAAGANAGVQFTVLGGERGWFTPDELAAAVKPPGHIVMPPTTLVSVENTHNMAGGVVVDAETSAGIGSVARQAGIACYLDGARLWNAAQATGSTVAELAAPFDLAWVAFSKGLGAPGGSMLAGPTAVIDRARRYRRMQGGAMRQAGVFAAAAAYALDHHLDGLADDHANARMIADVLAASDAVVVDPESVRTNIVIFELAEGAPPAPSVVERARADGVGILALGPTRLRAVTHRDVGRDECREAARILRETVET